MLAVAVGVAAVAAGRASAADAPWIVFSAQPDGASNLAQLFRVQTNGQGLQQLTSGKQIATDPAFSPNGKVIAFARLGSGIFRINLDGSGLKRLTSGGRDTYPVWSPNGKRIAFMRPYKKEWRLYTMSPTGKGQKRLPNAPAAGRPSWSADSKSIYFPSVGDIWKVSSTTGRLQTHFGLRLDPGVSQAATVSPNGKTFAYVGRRNPTGAPDCGESYCPQFALYTADAAKRKQRRVAADTGPAGWSPDSKTLVYVSKGALTLTVLATGATTHISSGTHVAAGDAPPAWQP